MKYTNVMVYKDWVRRKKANKEIENKINKTNKTNEQGQIIRRDTTLSMMRKCMQDDNHSDAQSDFNGSVYGDKNSFTDNYDEV
jgi:hypothetical protein